MRIQPCVPRFLTVLLVAACFLPLSGCGPGAATEQGDKGRRSQQGPDALADEGDAETAPLPEPSDAASLGQPAPAPASTEPTSLAAPSDPPPDAPVPADPWSLRALSAREGIEPESPGLTTRMVAPLAAPAREDSAIPLSVNPLRMSRESPGLGSASTLKTIQRAEPPEATAAAEPPAEMAQPDELPAAELDSKGAAQDAAPGEALADSRGNYQVVTVFYGTDRNAVVSSGVAKRPHREWFYLAASCLMLCGLFAATAMAGSRKRLFGSLAAISLSAGAAMGLMGTIAWVQGSGAVAGPGLVYGNERGQLQMGTCEVSIPEGHEVAELEAPSIFRLDFVEDPRKHVVLLEVEREDRESFVSRLRTRVEHSPRKEAFVFIHGFNVTFEDAARRTAQLAYDLDFQGAPVFYSWPSQGGLFQYAVDETNVVWTVPHLKEFLRMVARESGAESVHLIAHSMGNRALTSALQLLDYEREETLPLFHEVVLTAPDIDAEVFRRDIAPAIVKTARRVTLYASSNDEALVLSKKVHGYPRAGDSGAGLVVIPGIDTIDVSEVDTSLIGHDYYGSNATVIADLVDLVGRSKSPGERVWLEMAQLDQLMYWIFRKNRAAVSAAPANSGPKY